MTDLKSRSRRAFALWGLAVALGIGAWVEEPWPIRAALEWNAKIWAALQSGTRPARPQAKPPERGAEPRVNGMVGIEEPIDVKRWRLEIQSPELHRPLRLSLSDLKKMPKSEDTIQFRCVEGWSDVRSYAGVKFLDFMRRLGLGRRSGEPWPLDGKIPDDLYPYVAFETPDRGYYVSADMDSMLHPQTVLAWEMNGAPLLPDNGAPLRLKFSIKYGYKSLKRIGKIYFSETRPPDYWEEEGYDWFAGL